MNTLEATQAAFAELSAQPETDSPAVEPTADTPDPASSPASTPAASETASTTASPATQGEQSTTPPAPAGSEPAAQQRGPIPLDRHEAILAKARTDYEARLAKLAWAEKIGGNPEEIQERLRAFELAERDPELFARVLARDPRYLPFLNTGQPAAPAKPAVQEDPMPKPDRLNEDGTTGYSAERLQQVLDWKDRQTERKFAEQYGPVLEEHKGRKEWGARVTTQGARLEHARANWDGFKDHEAEIGAVIADAVRRRDTSVTLETAYMSVVLPKFRSTEAEISDRVRKQLIAESNQKPAAVTLQPSGPSAKPVVDTRGMSTEDIVRLSYSELAGS